jgi:curved DNA-binding protein CbpA
VKTQADNLEEVSRAFQVLSDPDKKSKFDKYGGDPESRFSGASASSGASPFSGFASQRAPRGGGGSMFEEEISPEELFRQFFGGGMGGGGFGGGPFGGFGGMYNCESLILPTQQLTRANRRQRLRLQHGRRTWRQSTPNGRWHASKKTTQPRKPTTSLTDGRTTISPAATSTVHHSSAVLTLLRRRTNIPKRPLRKRFTAYPKTRFHKTQSRLLRQPQRHRRLFATELERPVRPRRKRLRPKTRNSMRVGTNTEATGVPRSAGLLEQRSSQVASRGGYGHACVSEAQRLGLSY